LEKKHFLKSNLVELWVPVMLIVKNQSQQQNVPDIGWDGKARLYIAAK